MMKKLCALIALVLASVLALCLSGAPSLVAAVPNTERSAEAVLAKHVITVIRETDSAPAADGQAELSLPFDAAQDGKYLFEGNAFDSVLPQAAEIKGMIQRGNLIAIYNENGIAQDYEQTLGLPLGYIHEATEETAMMTVGKVYSTDTNGLPSIAQYDVYAENVNEATYDKFLNFVDRCISQNSAPRAAAIPSGDFIPMDLIGTASNYWEGFDEMGDISVTYEVYTAQSVSSQDYYRVHACVEAAPGKTLYGNAYCLENFTARLSTPTANASLYKTSPNTTTSGNSYTVNLGSSGWQDGGNTVNFGSAQAGSVPAAKISKVAAQKSCTWTVDVGDFNGAHNSTVSFEPGGVFYVDASNNRFLIQGDYTLTVDTIASSPEQALSASGIFYCDANDAW